MKRNIITIFTILILLISFSSVSGINPPIDEVKKLKSPSKGVYLGAYPDFGGYEDLVTSKNWLILKSSQAVVLPGQPFLITGEKVKLFFQQNQFKLFTMQA